VYLAMVRGDISMPSLPAPAFRLAGLPAMRFRPHSWFSAALRPIRAYTWSDIGGPPGGLLCRRPSLRCHPSTVYSFTITSAYRHRVLGGFAGTRRCKSRNQHGAW